MKKILTIIALMAFVGMAAKADNLKQGDKIVKTLELEFDEQAKIDNVFISWELSGDWNQFDYSFSQGTLKGNVYTIRANEYKDFANGHDGIALTIEGKEDSPEGNYVLALKVSEVSDGLDFPKDALNADFQINYILPPTPPIWPKILVLILIVALIVFLVLHLTAKFPEGMLQLGHDEVELKGRKKISVRKELEKIGRKVEDGMDVVLIKKRFISYQGPTIKKMEGCELHRIDGSLLAAGDIIYPDETIYGLKDANGDDIIIRQCL